MKLFVVAATIFVAIFGCAEAQPQKNTTSSTLVHWFVPEN
jgi:hypothetical protein